MSSIPVQTIAEGRGIPPPWLDKLLEFSSQVRHKAFELFEESGRPHGHDVNHWLEAERQLLFVPRYKLRETDGEIEVCIEIPGFDAGEVGVIALPDALLVKAESGPFHEQHQGSVRYSELNDQSLFRRIVFPALIDVTAVKARLDKGILIVSAPKARSEVARECQICQAI